MPLFEPAHWSFWFSAAWVALVMVLSVAVRHRRGKPIIPKAPAAAIFTERGASGRMASNCLLVAVTGEDLIVAPTFPFNLMFLPEIYGLEHNIPIGAIQRVERLGGWLGSNVAVFYGDRMQKLALRLRNPDAFVALLQRQLGRRI